MKQCIACGHSISYPVFKPTDQPLAALNLPRTQREATDALRYPMNFRMCAFCSHVWNVEFDYARVPYAEDSNLMYNSGGLWRQHMARVVDLLIDHMVSFRPEVAIDIGCGDGQFFSILKQVRPDVEYIGFEPGVDAKNIVDFTAIKDYFIPERDLKLYKPTVLVCRHVIEHIANPRDFVAEIAYWSLRYGISPVCLFEVPQFDTALELGRTGDFLYEHVSNFTRLSFKTMLKTSSYYVHGIYECYKKEVLVGVIQPAGSELEKVDLKHKAFFNQGAKLRASIYHGLEEFLAEGKKVVFWGGTGKSAAFLNTNGIICDRFPLVVDSDEHKVGRYVPGTGQLIRSANDLSYLKPDAIVITTHWRTRDICNEITRCRIFCPVYSIKDNIFQRVQ